MKRLSFIKKTGVALLAIPLMSFSFFTGIIDAIQLRQSIEVTKKTIYLNQEAKVVLICVNRGQVVEQKTISPGESKAFFDTSNLSTGRYAIMATCGSCENARQQPIYLFIIRD